MNRLKRPEFLVYYLGKRWNLESNPPAIVPATRGAYWCLVGVMDGDGRLRMPEDSPSIAMCISRVT